MQHHSTTFRTRDALQLHTESWLPTPPPVGVVVLSHGVAEHVGRYAHFAAKLVEHTFAAYGLDHRGHGQSDGKRGYFDTFAEPIDDLADYIDWVQAQHPALPLFLFGHSMGAVIATAYTLEHQQRLAGLITSGIPLAADEDVPGFAVGITRMLNQVAPDVPVLALDITGMSRDPAVLATWTTDPLVNVTLLRARTVLGIVGAARHIRANLDDLTLPLLVLHGGADRIVPSNGSTLLYDGASSMDKTLRVYPDLFHELINEPERDMIVNDIVRWLKAHLTTEAPA